MNAKKWCVLAVSLAILCYGAMEVAEAFSLGGRVSKVKSQVSRKSQKKTTVDKVLDNATVSVAALIALSGGSSNTADISGASAEMADGSRLAAPWDTREVVKPMTTGNGVYDIKEADGTKPTAWSTTPLDPLPPDKPYDRPKWVENRTSVFAMTNARLVAEYENLDAWRKRTKETGLGWMEHDVFRYDELGAELLNQIDALHDYNGTNPEIMDEYLISKCCFQRAVSGNIKPLYKHGLKLRVSEHRLPGYHPERDPGDTK